jgi:hypothetical protein
MFVGMVETRKALQDITQRFDASTLTVTDAGHFVTEVAIMRRLLDALFTMASARAADGAPGGDRIAARNLASNSGQDSGDTRQAIEAGRKLADLPATNSAARAGDLSAQHISLIAEAATQNPAAETDLLNAATRGTLALREACIKAKAAVEDPDTRTKRQRAMRTFRTWIDGDGMIAGRFRLQPEHGAGALATIEEETRRIFREHRSSGVHEPMDAYAADAFCNLLSGLPASDTDTDTGPDPDPGDSHMSTVDEPADDTPTESPPAPVVGKVRTIIHILIDHGALLRGRALPGETCEIPGVGPVNAHWVQSLLGDAFLTAIIKHGNDIRTVAHLGRHIPAVVRTALTVAGLECCVEGCTCRGYLEMDHCNIDYAGGGPTSFDNLCPLCSPDHKLKSQGWILGPPNPTTGKRRLTPPNRFG